MDVGKLGLDATKLGYAKATLTAVNVYGIDIVNGMATSNSRKTAILPSSVTTDVFSIYDINGDHVVNGADLSLAFYYYQSKAGDSNWELAKVADVNGDGVVDMIDLVAIYANYIP